MSKFNCPVCNTVTDPETNEHWFKEGSEGLEIKDMKANVKQLEEENAELKKQIESRKEKGSGFFGDFFSDDSGD